MPFGAFPPAARRRVVVTGIGMVTPVGLTTSSTWQAVSVGTSGTCSLSEVPYFLPDVIASSKALSDDEKQSHLQRLLDAMPAKVAAPVRLGEGRPTFAATAHEPRSHQFSAAAVDEALRDACLLEDVTPSEKKSGTATAVRIANKDRMGINIGMGIPSLADVTDVSLHLLGDIDKQVRYSRINPFFVPKILGNMVAGSTAIRYGLTGPLGSSVAACATGAHCIGEAAEWIRGDRADIMICGATEACITPVSVGGFCRMRALCTKYNDQPAHASRPFDAARGGFVIGEGAGILILEELEHAQARGVKHIYGELRGFGVTCDAHHVAAPHPEGRGAVRCVQEALRDGGGVPPSAVGYVNAHATGTIGDDIELAALERSLLPHSADVHDTLTRSSLLRVSSTKGSIGHLLGAAGSVEAGMAVLALDKQQAPPTSNLEDPCITEAQTMKGMVLLAGDEPTVLKNCEAVISTSFGFGGVNTALLFTKV